LVIVASSPDTPEIAAEVSELAERVRTERGNLVWIDHFISRDDLIHLHSDATVFVCPSIYEPFGLVILEAMACETAVVAARVGGVAESVLERESAFLVDYAPDAMDPFTSALGESIDQLPGDIALAAKMGRAGRQRLTEHYGGPAIPVRA